MKKMDVLQEIFTWSKDLPQWQNDAIVRLFANHSPSSDDIEDLFALLKSEHGIPDLKKRKPQKLKSGQIAIPAKPGIHVELISIKDLVNVNAIAEKQKLSFAPSGLTVIYGDNGSGKSGYTRVLKHACRARDHSEPILPNATLHPSKTGNAEAMFEIKVNGIDQEIKWINGKASPELLSTIAIFDHYCARAYLDSEGDFSYVPYGLDIFDGLVKICDILKTKIANEIDQNSPDLESFIDLQGSTAVGQIIENLSEETPKERIENLGTVTSKEIEQYNRIAKNIHENDPKGKADQLRIRIRRIKRLIDDINEKIESIDNSKLAQFQKLDKGYENAESAAKIAAEKFKVAGSYLKGTGGGSWRELFEAARKFSVEAYPGKQFPYTEKDARCPLCQQPLEEGAERLRQFETFIQQETEKNSRRCFDALAAVKKYVIALDMSLGLDEEILEEISQYDKKISEICQIFQKSLNTRYSGILLAFDTHAWLDVTNFANNPVDALNLLLSNLDKEARMLEGMVNESARISMKTQYDEYDYRIKLSQRKGAVLTAIQKMKKQSQLRECLLELDTTKITKKRHDISHHVITQKLTDSLRQEFKNLDVDNLKVIPRSKGTKGKTPYKLILDLPGSKNPSSILSEGEKNAICIGSFLAEVGLSGGSCGIVFDDPISSLDHRRREVVARRLVDEAKKRQVIIFTHDIFFLFVLIEEANRTATLIEPLSLVKKQNSFGFPEKGNPFLGMKTSDRVTFLRREHNEIAKIFKAGDEPEYRKRTIETYSHLRSSWERAIEEVLLRQVVLRFRRDIQTQKLSEVLVEDSDFKLIRDSMSKCSKITSAHDTAMEIGVTIPNPDELLQDINGLEIWRQSVEKRSQDVRKRRN